MSNVKWSQLFTEQNSTATLPTGITLLSVIFTLFKKNPKQQNKQKKSNKKATPKKTPTPQTMLKKTLTYFFYQNHVVLFHAI